MVRLILSFKLKIKYLYLIPILILAFSLIDIDCKFSMCSPHLALKNGTIHVFRSLCSSMSGLQLFIHTSLGFICSQLQRTATVSTSYTVREQFYLNFPVTSTCCPLRCHISFPIRRCGTSVAALSVPSDSLRMQSRTYFEKPLMQ